MVASSFSENDLLLKEKIHSKDRTNSYHLE